MRYSKEFKIECIKRVLNGLPLEVPKSCSKAAFLVQVYNWKKIYEVKGEVAFEKKRGKLTFRDKVNICKRIDSGETQASVAAYYCKQPVIIHLIYKKYLQEGFSGLKSSKPGRRPKMKKKPINKEEEKNKDKRIKELEELVEIYKARDEYRKKVDALVAKRKGQQTRKK